MATRGEESRRREQMECLFVLSGIKMIQERFVFADAIVSLTFRKRSE